MQPAQARENESLDIRWMNVGTSEVRCEELMEASDAKRAIEVKDYRRGLSATQDEGVMATRSDVGDDGMVEQMRFA